MKKWVGLAAAVFLLVTNSYSQENFANTLNIGLGVGGYGGYSRYVGRSVPVLHLNYELSVAKDFTLAPFISFYRYTDNYFYGNNGNPGKNYRYRQTVVPIGVKGTYYFDDLLRATSKWDFYLGASLGFALITSTWDSDYNGDRNYFNEPSALYLDIHIGTEYHISKQLGVFFDLSNNVSSVGLAIHN
jgi:hypothetical protein